MIDYIKLSQCSVDELVSVLNSDDVREHLMPHERFDRTSLANWIDQKEVCDSLAGCRIRAIMLDQQLAGWCGIQNDSAGYEVAIILAKPFWGYGKVIFKTMLAWAREFGHREVVIHLHESRPRYKFLSQLSENKVIRTEILGNKFNSYFIQV